MSERNGKKAWLKEKRIERVGEDGEARDGGKVVEHFEKLLKIF